MFHRRPGWELFPGERAVSEARSAMKWTVAVWRFQMIHDGSYLGWQFAYAYVLEVDESSGYVVLMSKCRPRLAHFIVLVSVFLVNVRTYVQRI